MISNGKWYEFLNVLYGSISKKLPISIILQQTFNGRLHRVIQGFALWFEYLMLVVGPRSGTCHFRDQKELSLSVWVDYWHFRKTMLTLKIYMRTNSPCRGQIWTQHT